MDRRLAIALQIVLAVVIAALAVVIFRQLRAPVRFEAELRTRRAAVVENLKDIRAAQQAFRRSHGRYTADFDTLTRFVLHDSLVYRRPGESGYFSRAVRDTIFAPRRLTDEQIARMRFVPYAPPGTEFELRAAQLPTASGIVVPVFEARTPYTVFLAGLDRRQVLNLAAEAQLRDRYPGVRVGSVTAATNDAGSWEE